MTGRIALNDGASIPQIGLGMWLIDQASAAQLVGSAIEAGYRSIDTAQAYNNEEGVGEAIRAASVPREDLFITSKLRNGSHRRDDALREFDLTMQKLGIEQIDLFLIHWPLPSEGLYVEAWKTLIELRDARRIRSIGVSNFNPDHLERIIGETGVVPAVNQIELHPHFQQRDKRRFHETHGIRIESWSPLGRGVVLGDPVIGAIAARHGKTPAQAIIRWHIQEGLIVIPKSANRERLAANLEIFDFDLDAEDMAAIAALDSPDGRTGADPATASFQF